MIADHYLCLVVVQPIVDFNFPEDARWNAERQAVEFGVEIRRVPRRRPGAYSSALTKWLIPDQSCKVGLRVPASVRR